MKISRDFILLSAIVGLLASAGVLYWSHQQVDHFTTAGIEFAQARTTRRAALADATGRLGHLKAQLLDTQRTDRVPPTYDEWSRQQGEARAAIAAIRLRFTELEPSLVTPIAPQPALVAASQKLRALSGTLLTNWQEFEQRGSGLTSPSRDYAKATLLPLIADELQPATDELAATDADDADHKAALLPGLIATAQRIRLSAIVALVGFVGLLAYAFKPGRRPARAKLLSAALRKSDLSSDPAELPENFERNVAAMDPRTPKILVAEQNPADSDTLSLLLTNAGFAVIGCDNGTVAREAIQRIPFALVLLDLHLPERGGLEVLKEARQRNPNLPALLICDAAENAGSLESSGPFITQIVRRPLNPRTLLWSVSEILYPGENREPREYSPNIPDDDEKPAPADASAPVSEPVPVAPIATLLPPPPAPVVAPPLPVAPSAPPPPEILAPVAAPAEAPRPRLAIARKSLAEPAPVSELASVPEPAPVQPAPEPVAPAAAAPTAPAAAETPVNPPVSTDGAPVAPRRKMVRRKLVSEGE